MVAEYTAEGDTFHPVKPHPWSERHIPSIGGANFDLSPDGKRLAVPLPDEGEPGKGSLHVNFLLNYFDELRRRMPLQ
jgi:hypothetical protein